MCRYQGKEFEKEAYLTPGHWIYGGFGALSGGKNAGAAVPVAPSDFTYWERARWSASVMARTLNQGIGGRVISVFAYLTQSSSVILPMESLRLVG